jgi:hypothetical protein
MYASILVSEGRVRRRCPCMGGHTVIGRHLLIFFSTSKT